MHCFPIIICFTPLLSWFILQIDITFALHIINATQIRIISSIWHPSPHFINIISFINIQNVLSIINLEFYTNDFHSNSFLQLSKHNDENLTNIMSGEGTCMGGEGSIIYFWENDFCGLSKRTYCYWIYISIYLYLSLTQYKAHSTRAHLRPPSPHSRMLSNQPEVSSSIFPSFLLSPLILILNYNIQSYFQFPFSFPIPLSFSLHFLVIILYLLLLLYSSHSI